MTRPVPLLRRREPSIGVYNHRLYAHYRTGQFVDLARELSASHGV